MIGTTNVQKLKYLCISIYKRGDLCTSISGGWANGATDVDGYTLNGGSYVLRGTATFNANSISASAKEVSGGPGALMFVGTKSKINLTNISKIQFIIKASYNGSSPYHKLYISTDKYYPGNITSLPTNVYPTSYVKSMSYSNETAIDLNVSSITGKYYVGIALQQWTGGAATNIEIFEINLFR